jgi:uncharacterized protein YecT (DUF1311 family)
MAKRRRKGQAAEAAMERAPFTHAMPHEMCKAAAMAALALIMFWPAGAMADWYGSAYVQCEGTTAETVQCLDRLTANAQDRLGRAYDRLLTLMETPERGAALEQAQRQWEAYRKANCLFYREGAGSIAALEAAECMRVLTSRRARELEQVAEPEAN